MAEAAEIQGVQRVVAIKSLNKWREKRHKRDAKCAGNHKFANGLYKVIGKIHLLMFCYSCHLSLNFLKNTRKKNPKTLIEIPTKK